MSLTSNSLFQELKSRIPRKQQLLVDHLFKLRLWMGAAKSQRPKTYLNSKGSFEAYLQYYLPLHYPELSWILQHNGITPQKEKIQKVLDIGSGPGTHCLSLLSFFEKHKYSEGVHFDLLDQSHSALKFAKNEIQKSPNAFATYHDCLLPQFPKNLQNTQYDLIIAGYFLNEWGNGPKFRDKKIQFLSRTLQRSLKENGLLLLIEPPLRESTLDLMNIRNYFAEQKLQIVGPCPHTESFCPMLKQRSGWCYTQVPNTKLPQEMLSWDRKISKWLDIKFHQRSFSYLLIRKALPTPRKAFLTCLSDMKARRGIYCDGTKTLLKNKKCHRGDYLALTEK